MGLRDAQIKNLYIQKRFFGRGGGLSPTKVMEG